MTNIGQDRINLPTATGEWATRVLGCRRGWLGADGVVWLWVVRSSWKRRHVIRSIACIHHPLLAPQCWARVWLQFVSPVLFTVSDWVVWWNGSKRITKLLHVLRPYFSDGLYIFKCPNPTSSHSPPLSPNRVVSSMMWGCLDCLRAVAGQRRQGIPHAVKESC